MSEACSRTAPQGRRSAGLFGVKGFVLQLLKRDCAVAHGGSESSTVVGLSNPTLENLEVGWVELDGVKASELLSSESHRKNIELTALRHEAA